MKKISVVIPCYYSEKTIKNVVFRVIDTIEKDGRFDYEVICINDGSVDGTYAVLREMADSNVKIKVLDLARNFGQHSALMAGFNYVTGDYILCLDDDGQNPPEEMFKLIDKLIDEDYDLVSAKYDSKKEKRSIIRKLGSKISFAMSKHMIGMPDDIELNSYYVMKRFVVDEIIKYDNPYPFVHGLVLRVTKKMANVMITHNEREVGTSGYTLKSLFSLWLNGFTAFSEKPLRMAAIFGFVVSFLGFLSGIIVIIMKLLGVINAVGYASIVVIILIFSGIIMMFLGLIGEYVGRIYICLNRSPQFVIRQEKNTEGK